MTGVERAALRRQEAKTALDDARQAARDIELRLANAYVALEAAEHRLLAEIRDENYGDL